jgi:uncharacterized OB-fold protein
VRAPGAIFADRCRRGKLSFTVAADGRPVFPPRLGLAWRDSAGLGTVYAATTARPRGAPPRGIVLVDLDEGFRMMSRVDGIPAEDVTPGLRVRLDFAPGDPPLPIFRPA